MAISDGTKSDLLKGIQNALEEVTTAANNVDDDGNNINSPPPEEVFAQELTDAIVAFINAAIDAGELES